jgi:hypothetical protein
LFKICLWLWCKWLYYKTPSLERIRNKNYELV